MRPATTAAVRSLPRRPLPARRLLRAPSAARGSVLVRASHRALPHGSDLAALDAAALADAGYDENEVAAKMAGQPCMCQHVPGSGVGLLVLGVFLLLASRIPAYLNRQHHQIQIVRASSPLTRPLSSPARSTAVLCFNRLSD